MQGKEYVRRKPYRKLNSVAVDHYKGNCPDCCCPSTIFIKGFFAEHSCVPIVPLPIYRNSDGFTVLDEMASEVEMRIALCRKR